MGDVVPFPDVRRNRCPCGWLPPVMRTYRVEVDVLGAPILAPLVGIRQETLAFTIGYACPECGTVFTTTFGGST